MRKLVDDLDYCNQEDLIKQLSFDRGRIRDVLPFSMDLQWLYKLLEMPDKPSVFLGTISYEGKEGDEDVFYIDFSPRINKSLAKLDNGDITGIYLSEVNLSVETNKKDLFKDQMSYYFMLKEDKWYFEESMQNVLKMIVNLELLNKNLLDDSIISFFSLNKCRPIIECMDLHKDELLDVDIKKLDYWSMCIYRLIHNILLNSINENNAKAYIDIFVKHQKLSFDGIEKDELFYCDDDNTIIVPKDKLESDAVLRSVYSKYIRKHACRDELWWYSPEGLASSDGVFYRNDNRINTMRFLFDNTEQGTATLRTLAANIGKEKEWLQFELARTTKSKERLENIMSKQLRLSQSYICGDCIIKPVDVYIANSPKIVVHSYYGTDEADQLLREFFKYCGLEEDKYEVSHEKEILYLADRIEEECKKLNLDYEKNQYIYIVIREFNMTKCTLMPKGAVGKSNIASVLFVQKEESRGK